VTFYAADEESGSIRQ